MNIRWMAALCVAGTAVPALSQTLIGPYDTTSAGGYSMMVGGSSGTQGVAEFRAGNLGSSGTHEYTVGQNTSNSAQFTAGQFAWGSNQPIAFQFQRTGSVLSLTLGSNTITYTHPTSGDDIFIRMAAVSAPTGSSRTVQLTGLQADGILFGGTQSATDGYAWYRIENVASNFDVRGNVALIWSGSAPSQSQMSVSFKVAEAVPEPGTIAALAMGAAFLAARRRRKA